MKNSQNEFFGNQFPAQRDDEILARGISLAISVAGIHLRGPGGPTPGAEKRKELSS
jgi:hypothetical protein